MAYLVKCSLCNRDVSNECNSCPGCGHNVAREVRQKEFEMKPVVERIVGSWRCSDGSSLRINSDNTFRYSTNFNNFAGRYSISGDKFNVLSRDETTIAKMAPARFSLKGDTLTWWFKDGQNITDTFTRL